MHKTTRQIWASSSASPTSSCFFCDFHLLLSHPAPSTPIPTRAISARTHHRTVRSAGTIATSSTRIQPRHQWEQQQQQRLASCLRVFGINSALQRSSYLEQQQYLGALQHQSRLFRSHRQQAVCSYTTKASPTRSGNVRSYPALRDKASSRTRPAAYLGARNVSSSGVYLSELMLPSLPGIKMSLGSRSLLASPRFLSTSTSASVASDPEADLSSSSFHATAKSPTATPPTATSSTSPSTISPSSSPLLLDLTAAVKEIPPTSDFQSLFPDIPASFAESSSRNPFVMAESNFPWRNNLMPPGSELEESLRKSVFERDPVSSWWPLYERVAGQWRDRSPESGQVVGTSQGPIMSALVRPDFMRFIGALKTSPPSSDRLSRLEQVFEDLHLATGRSKSNVKVYSAFLDALHFWKMDGMIPEWIERIKSKIMATAASISSPSSELPTLHNYDSYQEQYHDYMGVLANANQVDMMLNCLEDLKSGHIGQLRPTVMAYDAMLELYMKHKDTASALRVLQEMKDVGLEPRLTTFNILLRGHLENKDVRAAQRVFESLLLTDIRPNIYTFNLLMSGYLRMGEIELVNGFYKSLGEYGLLPNSKTYRILMKTHLRQGQVDQVVDLFCKLKESSHADLHPGTEDYRVLILALATHGRMPDALRVLRELTETAKMPVTTPIYNVFLTQYAREGKIEKARRILDRIISEKLPLVDGSINPLIRAYLAKRDFDKVEEMTKLMNQYGVEPSRTTFNIMIHSTKSSGNLDMAMELYQRMMVEGVDPDVWTYNTLLDLHISKLSPNRDSIQHKGDAGAMTEEQIAEFVPRIETLLQDMKAKGIKPDVVTYGKLIHQYVVLRDVEQAEVLFHEMVKSGISPNSYVFNTLMNGFTLIEEMDKAVELFRRMPKYGVDADATTFTTLIKGYANSKQMVLAQEFANSLQQQSSQITMDQYCLHTLMQLAQKSRQPGMALDFFEMMRGRGIEPDKVTFTILINSLSKEFADSFSASSGNNKFKSGARGHAGRKSGAAVVRSPQAESAAEAIESILSVIQQESYPLHHSEITTMISAYFRLGRPLAAIEFFKTSYWRGNPKLSTTNCGAMFLGLLAPEHSRRYDGIVLNLYQRMLAGTKEVIRTKQERKKHGSDKGSLNSKSRKFDQAKDDVDRLQTPWTASFQSSLPSSLPSSRRPTGANSEYNFAPSHDLPVLDLVTINILFQSFSQRQNWNIVLQLWKDLESVGAENLYPFEMPLELLGWAAQAHHSTANRKDRNDAASNTTLQHLTSSGSDASTTRTAGETQAEKLLRRLWDVHPWMGADWSTKIYGFNIFETLTPNSSSSSSASSSSALMMGSAGTSFLEEAPTSVFSTHSSTSVLTSYFSEERDQRSYRQRDFEAEVEFKMTEDKEEQVGESESEVQRNPHP